MTKNTARRYDVSILSCLLLILPLLLILSCGESFRGGGGLVPVTGRILRLPELRLTALHGAENSEASQPSHDHRRRRGNSSPSSSSSSMIDRIDVDSVSDAQALLACRSHLQRRNKLGQWKQRRRPVQLSSKQDVDKGDTGVF